MTRTFVCTLLIFCSYALALPAQTLSGELKKWHKITLTFDGPISSETANPNPFLDYRLNVTFTNGGTSYVVPGYFAADGNAAETGATSGNKWRVHFAPDAEGTWTYNVSFRSGTNVAVGATNGSPASFDGLTGSFIVEASDKSIPDNRARGRLRYIGEHFLQYAETGEYFIKIGADSPENFLAYDDFDNTPNNGGYRKSWGPHVSDWSNGDPVWQGDKGKGIIGAINYLASEGQNAFSFLTMNINGDDENVFPYINDNSSGRTRMDCSKLDQWEVVFEHANSKGFYLHFKTQEQENDQMLDGGALGTQRKLYYRELIARFSHHLALNWNMGEENSNTAQQQKDFAQFFYDNDPYRHHVVIHTRKPQVDDIYSQLVGNQSKYTGISLQANWNEVHQRCLTWVQNSAAANKKWIIASDEQSPASIGVPTDGYSGTPSQGDIRKGVLWGNLMAGGAGVEYYFGYQLSNSDLTCQNYRDRDQMWDYNRYARDFFQQYTEFWEMSNYNDLINNSNNNNARYCLAKPGDTYVIFLPTGGSTQLDLENYNQTFEVRWYNPRSGGALQTGSISTVTGPGNVSIGFAPSQNNQDWAVLVTLDPVSCPPAGTACDDGDPTTTDDEEDGNCNCVGAPCPAAGTSCDDGDPDTINDVEDGECNCAGVTACPPAGTPCDDGDPTTTDDQEDGNCNCVGAPCPPAGTACDDGDPDTFNDVEDGECNCAGVTACPPAGTPCDDGDPTTTDDQEDGNCNCGGTPCPEAGTACDDGNPNTENDVEDGFCNCAGTDPNGSDELWLEAECASVGGNWTIETDANASNDAYLLPPEAISMDSPPTDPADLVVFTFSISQAGNYKVFGRTMTLSGDEDSFWVRANNGDWLRWNNINDGNYGAFYQWEQIGEWNGGAGNDPVTFNLNAGVNTLYFSWREPNARLDKLFVTPDGDIPSGLGPEPPGGCSVCPAAGTSCDDGDPTTFDDQQDGECNCVGTPCPAAGTSCDDGDPTTFDDQQDGECNCVGTPCPAAGTSCDDGDPTTFDDEQDGECNCVGTPCPAAGTSCDDGDPTTFDDEQDGECNCVGTPCPAAGTACDDGDPTTFNDQEDGECNCVGTPCPAAGTSCDDGDPTTINDEEDGECNCIGVTACPAAGTACDDGDPTTFNDQEDGECNCVGTPCPAAGTACDDGDPTTFNDQEDGECNCVGTPCPAAGTSCDDGDPTTFDDEQDGECNCVGTPCPAAGTACDDGDPTTINDEEDGECNCIGVTACPAAGTACDDGDPTTFNDQEDGECNCVGTPCPAAGTACDDGDPTTFNDQEDGECNCVGTPCPAAGTACDDGDPTTFDDQQDGECNCVGTPCPAAGTSCDDGDPTTFDDQQDGECNCVGTPCPAAGTSCDDGDPTTFDDQQDGECNCVGTPCPAAGTACDDGDPTTFNDQEDGECNCVGFSEEISIMMEAECAMVGDEWGVVDEVNASNDAYTQPPMLFSRNDPPDAAKDRVRFIFDIVQAGTYRVFARSMVFDEDSNSYWVRIDDGSWIPWNKVNDQVGAEFAWDQVGIWENGQPEAQSITFDLDPGAHTLDFAWREPNIRLDKVYVVVETGSPLGIGEEGANCDPTSTGEETDGLGWSIFPNPATEEVFVRISQFPAREPVFLEILDPLGQIRHRRRIAPGESGPFRFDLQGWPAGMYWMRIMAGDTPPLTRAFILRGD